MDRTERLTRIAAQILAAQAGTEHEVTVTHAVDLAFKLDAAVRERTRNETFGK